MEAIKESEWNIAKLRHKIPSKSIQIPIWNDPHLKRPPLTNWSWIERPSFMNGPNAIQVWYMVFLAINYPKPSSSDTLSAPQPPQEHERSLSVTRGFVLVH